MKSEQPRSSSNSVEFTRDDVMTRREMWLFVPLLAVLVALPLAILAMLGTTLWLRTHQPAFRDASQAAPTTFASRWPDMTTTQSGTVIR